MIKKNTDEQISRFELDSNTHSRHHYHDKLAPPDELQELDVMKTKMMQLCHTSFFKWRCFKMSLQRLILLRVSSCLFLSAR